MTPVLVDASVWRGYFRGSPSAEHLRDLLEEDDAVLMHSFVMGEMVLGGLSNREQVLLDRLPTADVVRHEDVLDFVRRRRLMRRGIGWVDAHLLASALVASALLWSADVALARVAADLNVGFAPTR